MIGIITLHVYCNVAAWKPDQVLIKRCWTLEASSEVKGPDLSGMTLTACFTVEIVKSEE